SGDRSSGSSRRTDSVEPWFPFGCDARSEKALHPTFCPPQAQPGGVNRESGIGNRRVTHSRVEGPADLRFPVPVFRPHSCVSAWRAKSFSLHCLDWGIIFCYLHVSAVINEVQAPNRLNS